MADQRPDVQRSDSDFRFPRKNRLRSRSDYSAVYRHQSPVSDDVLLVFFRPNELGYPRLGLSVSRKVGNAVTRNRWKRLIRESFRHLKSALPEPVDIIVIPRQENAPTLAMVQSSLAKLARRIGKRLGKDR